MNERQVEFADKAYTNGHSCGTLAEAAIALWTAFTKADLQRQRTLIGDLIDEAERYAREGERWDESATTMRSRLVDSARDASAHKPAPIRDALQQIENLAEGQIQRERDTEANTFRKIVDLAFNARLNGKLSDLSDWPGPKA